MLQYRQLRYFVKIVEAGSFSSAASTLHVAQPALSQQIANLEEQLGLSLLLRSARGVRPTAAGTVFYRQAAAILQKVEQLQSLVKKPDEDAGGSVGLGMTSTLFAPLATGFAERCRSAMPKLALSIAVTDSESIKKRIIDRRLDAGLVFEDELTSTFERRPLFRQRLFYIARDPHPTARKTITLQELADIPLILPSRPNITRTALDRAFTAAGVTPKVAFEIDVLANMLDAVRSGFGGTVLPKSNLADVGGHELATPLLIEPSVWLSCSIIVSNNSPTLSTTQAVCDMLTDFVGSHIRERAYSGTQWIAGNKS